MNSETQPTLISSGILDDVNLVLGIDPWDGQASQEYHWQRKPSPWEIAYFLIRLATYLESLVFFDKVDFIRATTPIPIEGHLLLFTTESILRPATLNDRRIESFEIDNELIHLAKLVNANIYSLKGFQALFRTTKAYQDFDIDMPDDYFVYQFISTYWASKKLDRRLYANKFESPGILYSESNLSRSKRTSFDVAMKILNQDRCQYINDELKYDYDISLPPVLTLAILEACDLHDLFRIVINMRKEAINFRRKMIELDESKALVTQIKDAITALESEGSILSRMFSTISIEANLGIVRIGFSANKLISPKKHFLTRLKGANPQTSAFAGKISKIFYKSDLTVNGREVLDCMRMFCEKEL